MYISNIEKVIIDDWTKTNICKFGIYNFEIPFFHFLLQITIIAYSILLKRLYIGYNKNIQKEKEEEDKIKQRIENEKNNSVRNDLFGLSRLRRGNTLGNTIKASELERQSKKSTLDCIA